MGDPVWDWRIGEETQIGGTCCRRCCVGREFCARLVQVDFLIAQGKGSAHGAVGNDKLVDRHTKNVLIKRRCSINGCDG